MTVYVVTRSEEHSDYVEKVFTSKAHAEEYCQKYNSNEDEYQRDITERDIEEPASEDLEEAADKYSDNLLEQNRNRQNPGWDYEDGYVDAISYHTSDSFIAGANWQKQQMIDKACKWIAEEAYKYFWWDVDECFVDYDTKELTEDFRKAMEE